MHYTFLFPCLLTLMSSQPLWLVINLLGLLPGKSAPAVGARPGGAQSCCLSCVRTVVGGGVTGPPRQNCRRSPWVPSELPLFFLNKHSQCPWSVPKVLKFLLVFWLSRERLSGLFSPLLWMPLHLCFSRLWAELRTRGATWCVYFVSGLGSAQCLWNAPLLQRAVWFPVSSLQTFCFRNLLRLLYPSHRRCLTFASFLLLWVTALSICAHISAHRACTAVWVLRPWTVSLPEINMLGINPAPQNMTLFGEKFFPEIIKLRWGLWGGPSSKVTGVLIKRGSLDPGRRAQKDHSECPALCDPLVCSRPGSPVHGTLQAGIPEWVAIAPSRGSSRPKGWTPVRCVSCISRWVLHHLGSPCREGRPRGKLATHQGVQTPGLQDWVVTHLCCLSHEDWGAVRAALGRRTECVPWGGIWGSQPLSCTVPRRTLTAAPGGVPLNHRFTDSQCCQRRLLEVLACTSWMTFIKCLFKSFKHFEVDCLLLLS